MNTHIDQMGNVLSFDAIPQKIISLVPSQTELLYYLEVESHLVGLTKFCIHPTEAKQEKTVVGGTKKVNFEKIKTLAPDLIIANKEENTESEIKELQKHYPVWISDINSVEDALDMISKLGLLLNKTTEASLLIDKLNNLLLDLPKLSKPIKMAYLIWKKPYMIVGKNTYINDWLLKLGFQNIVENEQSRYPEMSIEQLQQKQVELIMLSSEPYPFKQQHIDELQKHLPTAKILLVDGEMFSWYGSRMLDATNYFKQLLKIHFV